MKLYETFELSYYGTVLTENWADINLYATFVNGEKSVSVKGFYDGDGIYKIRFLPMEPGLWHWTVSGIVTDEGEESCEASESCGPVRAKGTHFAYEDGKVFHPFGTTVYALIHQDEALIERTMQTLSEAPFNKIRICVFPKHYDYNHNEPRFYAFEKCENGSWDPCRPTILFWQTLEKYIVRLGEIGLQVDLILFHPYDRWGFDGMGFEKDKIYLDYLIRRLAAFPNIWWSLANEYELCKRSEEEWFAIERYIAGNDPYQHLLSCHNIFKIWDAKRPFTTHASIQSKSFHRLGDWVRRIGKPVMLDECCYEGNIEHFWGCISAREMTRRFWRCIASGAYCTHGETYYSDDEILWWSRGGELKGDSALRIAFCREVVESLPGHFEKEESFYDKMISLKGKSDVERETILSRLEETPRRMIQAFLDSGENLEDARAAESAWYGHIGDEVILHFYDTRPIARETIHLPEGKKYRIEILDTWNMTRKTIARDVSGEYTVILPGREDMALLAIQTQ